jgi:hypothetical protein
MSQQTFIHGENVRMLLRILQVPFSVYFPLSRLECASFPLCPGP